MNKRILVATDSYKHALSAPEACKAIANGIRRSHPQADVVLFPLADGGEGTAAILASHLGAEPRRALVHDALMRPLEVTWYYLPAEGVALMDMAAASGIQHLEPSERNPMLTSTFGTGEVLKAALEAGAKKIYLGIGGSATNDAGMGMASALGWKFLDANDRVIPPKGANLEKVFRVLPPAHPFPAEVIVLCDVDNPLFGPKGAAFTFAMQKGASADDVPVLDAGLRHFAKFLIELAGEGVSTLPGAGAAGGLGAGAVAFLGARLVPGAEVIMELTHFDQAITGRDLVITGEGQLDEQTLRGKLVARVCQKCLEAGVPVIALCGKVVLDEHRWREMGLCLARSITPPGMPLERALKSTAVLLEQAAFEIFSEGQWPCS
ncbi:MAG: glycerate kinase [Saprospiraceae bacterium]|nr:MAG: glycerate kinase [Saprospiraceae bacterium]